MSTSRLQAFKPQRGKMTELWLTREEQHVLANAPRAPGLVVVGTAGGYSETIFEAHDRIMKLRVQTTQARRVAEGAVWLGVLHAMAAMGEVGAAALELAAEGVTDDRTPIAPATYEDLAQAFEEQSR